MTGGQMPEIKEDAARVKQGICRIVALFFYSPDRRKDSRIREQQISRYGIPVAVTDAPRTTLMI
jgi:hypothetical protein